MAYGIFTYFRLIWMVNVGKMNMENLAKVVVFTNGAGLDIFHLASFLGSSPVVFRGVFLEDRPS